MENQTERHEYSQDERRILEILATFENELNYKLQEEKRELKSIKYYEEAELKNIKFKNIFITIQKNENGNLSYHIYDKDGKEIITIGTDGKIKTIPGLEDYFKDSHFNIENEMKINDKEPGRLRGISEKMDKEEMQNELREQKENENQANLGIEESIIEQGNELGLNPIRKITDTTLSEKIPEIFEPGKDNYIGFSKEENKYAIATEKNGRMNRNEHIEQAIPTMKTILSIDEKGEKIERKVPHALMKTDKSNKEIALIIDEYGYIDIETVDVMPNAERIARRVRTDGEDSTGEQSYSSRREENVGGTEYNRKIARNVKNIENAQQEAGVNDNDITEDDYIPGTKKTWGELMNETGESLTKLVERYNEEMAKENSTSEDTVKRIEEDYGMLKTHGRIK